MSCGFLATTICLHNLRHHKLRYLSLPLLVAAAGGVRQPRVDGAVGAPGLRVCSGQQAWAGGGEGLVLGGRGAVGPEASQAPRGGEHPGGGGAGAGLLVASPHSPRLLLVRCGKGSVSLLDDRFLRGGGDGGDAASSGGVGEARTAVKDSVILLLLSETDRGEVADPFLRLNKAATGRGGGEASRRRRSSGLLLWSRDHGDFLTRLCASVFSIAGHQEGV